MFDITRPSFLVMVMIVVLGSAMLVESATAIPTTGAATAVGSNNATLAMTGAGTTCWFVWGQLPLTDQSWKTPNMTPAAGVCSYNLKGSPILASTVFYYRACDETGCGNTLSFTTAAVTPLPTTTYGATFDNLTENGMDITLVGVNSVAPYMWLVPGFEALIFGLIFSAIFLGLWLRGRDVTVPMIVGFIIGSFIFVGNYGLALGIPYEFAAMGQGLMYAAMAGVILAIIKK